MKKRIVSIILFVIGIIVLTLSILLIVSSIITDALVFEHGACEEVFGCSPKEFLNGDFPLSDQLHGRYAYAFVNSKDELEIYFTDKQKEAALELELFQDLQEIQNNSRIEVALDYKKFTIIVYDDKVGLNDFEVIINNANKIAFWQFLKGDPNVGFSVYYKYGPYDTEKLLAKWPDDVE